MKKTSILYLFLLFSHFSFAASSVLVWPILQTIQASQSSNALWLENRGDQPVHMQIRILGWQQKDFQNIYNDQSEVIASPPFAVIAPQQRQLIRLIRIAPPPVSGEKPFRIILDELPDESKTIKSDTAGLRFRMRYVLPLFLTSSSDNGRPLNENYKSETQLSWKIIRQNGEPLVEIRNQGDVHARLTNVFWGRKADPKDASLTLANGFLGYVLPGASMRFSLPSGKMPPANETLFAQLTDNGPFVAITP